jgi:hypothetical protein
MRVRNLMLATLGGGVLLGTVIGATTSTTMKPTPEPPWRQAARSGIEPSYPPAGAKQQDLGTTSTNADHTPTWKRHLPEYQIADFTVPTHWDFAALPAPEVADHQDSALRTQAAEAGRPADDSAAPTTLPAPVAEAPAEPVRAGT